MTMCCTKAIFLDRDGVLNKKAVLARYVRHAGEFEWMPGAISAIRELKKAGYTILIISNQAGVGRGHMTKEDLERIHEHMQTELKKAGAHLDAFYCCLHTPDAGCECRKPKIGLILQAQRDYHLNLEETPFIGDDLKDLVAGRTAGCPTYLLDAQTSLLDMVQKRILGPNRGVE